MQSEADDAPTAHLANRLARETSAYLRQHMHNPVDWFPWGAEALAYAHDLQRPLLVSIGYSACHWCHVMERESFEDLAVAARMNEVFVNVKVDREERPDVDQLYMDALLRLTGHGGWPLTAFCLPDGRPFHLGTYFPPVARRGLPSFREMIDSVDRAWRTRRAELERAAGSLLEALQRRPESPPETLPGADALAACAREWMARADTTHGGFGSQPKFPTPTSLDLLLAAADVLPEDEAREATTFVAFSLREMSRRGLFDQLGGGFHRYCVDEAWTIPHFEKMLYDQGQLLRTYTEAWRRTGDDELLWPIRETAAFLKREMSAPDGGFFSSQDADSEGAEGAFFVWRPGQIVDLLGHARGTAFCAAHGVGDPGNFERDQSQLVDLARAPRTRFASERATLFAARATRIAPAFDRKRVTAFNALVISGLARAGALLDETVMLADAGAAARFVISHLRASATEESPPRVLRVFAEGRAHVPGFLDDLSCLLEACLDLHRAGVGDDWLGHAFDCAMEIVTHFFDPTEEDLFFTPSDGERLALRPRSDHDGATPHSTGLAVLGLVRLAAIAAEPRFANVAEAVLRTHAAVLTRTPAAFPTLLRAAALAERGVGVAVVVGAPGDPRTVELARRARHVLAPDDHVLVHAPGAPVPRGLDPAWFAGREAPSGRPVAHLCRAGVCSLPVTDPADLNAFRPSAGARSLR